MSHKKSVTLIELLIAIVLLGIIVLGIAQIDIFSHFHVISADRRAKINNEASYVLEHMTKQIAQAIGNELINGSNTVVNLTNIAGNTAIRVYIDLAADGVSAGDGQRGTGGDRWIAYRFRGAAGPGEYQAWYCPECTNAPCTACNPNWGTVDNIIAKNISAVTPIKPVNASNQLNNNFVTIQLTACWNPAIAESRDNPCVDMNARVKMPSVSVN